MAERGGGRREGDRERDLRLARRAARGDVAAFGALVRRHSAAVDRVTGGIAGPDDAPDASQEAWIRAWRGLAGFRGESSFATWLHRVAANAALDARRKASRRTRLEAPVVPPDALPDAPDGGEGPEGSVLARGRAEELAAALRKVRPEHRRVLLLRHAEGLSYAGVAEALGVPPGTAKGWVFRGRAALRAALTGARAGAA